MTGPRETLTLPLHNPDPPARLQRGAGGRLEMRMDARWSYQADAAGARAALRGLRCHLLVVHGEDGGAAAQACSGHAARSHCPTPHTAGRAAIPQCCV